MLERYRTLIEGNSGAIHRLEDWGRRQLAFPIAKLHKAHYILMNIECDGDTLAELEGFFRFNDAVLRHLTVRRQNAISEQSLMMKAKEEKDRSSRSYEESRKASAASEKAAADDAKSATDASAEDFRRYKILLRQYDLPLDIHPFVEGAASFPECWDRRVVADIGGVEASFASLDDLIAMKRAADRPKDREDLRQLERLRQLRNQPPD